MMLQFWFVKFLVCWQVYHKNNLCKGSRSTAEKLNSFGGLINKDDSLQNYNPASVCVPHCDWDLHQAKHTSSQWSEKRMDHKQNSRFYQKYFYLSQFLLALNRRKNLWREFNQRKTRTKLVWKLGSKRYKHQEGSESNKWTWTVFYSQCDRKKCVLNKKGRNKCDRVWNKLGVLQQNIISLSGQSTERTLTWNWSKECLCVMFYWTLVKLSKTTCYKHWLLYDSKLIL